MDTYQYMKIPLRFFTSKTKKEYNIISLALNVSVHVKIQKGMYGHKEARIIAFRILVKNLTPPIDTTRLNTHQAYGGTQLETSCSH